MSPGPRLVIFLLVSARTLPSLHHEATDRFFKEQP